MLRHATVHGNARMGNETTIRRLGQPGVNASALNPQIGINLDQTRLGQPVRDVRVHLIGSYTPLPNEIGGQVVASVGAQKPGMRRV